MRRTDIVKSIVRVLVDMDNTLMSIGDLSRNSRPDNFTTELLRIYKEYVTACSQYGEVERELIAIAGLSSFNDPATWDSLLSNQPFLGQMSKEVRTAEKRLRGFLGLIDTDATRFSREATPTDRTKRMLSLTLIERENAFSSPSRLIMALESITLMYTAIARVFGERGDSLSVIACDSGSDKSFDFFGAAEPISSVKELILGLYDRLVFHKQKGIDLDIEDVTRLPAVVMINQAESEGKLSSEEAEILRRKTLEGLLKFMQAGVTIPEMRNSPGSDPRQIMAPEPKMLVAGMGEKGPDDKDQEENSFSLN